MKSIYILLTQTGTYLSRFIHLITADTYTHASMAFVEDLEPLYSFSRKYVYLCLPAGLHVEPLRTGFFKRHSDIPCALYELRVSDEVYEAAKSEVEQMMTEAKRYQFSVLGLILCKLNIPMERKYRYFCSQFVAEILKRSGALELPKEPSLMRPNDYTEIEALSCRFEGKFCTLLSLLEKQQLPQIVTQEEKEYAYSAV